MAAKFKKYRRGDTVVIEDVPWIADGKMPLRLREFHAIMYDSSGKVVDVSYCWETTESMVINEGLVPVCRFSADQPQYDRLLRVYRDCWGVSS